MKLDTGTVTTLAGAGLAVAIGLVDHWYFHNSLGAGFDTGLVGAGLGAFLGVNPLEKVRPPAA